MKALIIADDDAAINSLPEEPVDILVSLGDLHELSISRAAERCRCRQVFAVKGNHDSGAPFPAPIADLHLQTYEVGGLSFGGFGGAWKYKPRGHHLFEQTEVELLLSGFPKVDVFVAHNSPRGIHDQPDEVHTGFDAFVNYIEKHQPRYFFHGHQHVSQETMVGSTRVIGVYGFRHLEIER